MTITTTETKQVTIKRGEYGANMWFVRITGNGYPVDIEIESVDLVKLRNEGYVIRDPQGWCDLSPDCPPELQEPWNSQSAMDADSAGHPGELPGCGMSDADADILGRDEVAYLRTIEEEL